MSLTISEAVAVLTNYENRTGKSISPEQLQDGSLAKLLTKEDYNLKGKVSLHHYSPFSPNNAH